MKPLRLRIVGEAMCWTSDGRAVTPERKDALLLAYLAIEGPTARTALASMLWPDVDKEQSLANLRQRRFRLRKLIGVDLLEGSAVARLRADLAVELDGQGGASGELLVGVTEADAGGLGPWLCAAREHRRAERAELLAAAASRHEDAGQLALALAAAQQLVECDSTSEHAHRRVMRLHYLRGDRAAALAAFDHCCDVLERVLGVAPEPETEALRARVEALTEQTVESVRRPLPVSVLRPPRLIGRVRELEGLRQAWRAGRLCTLLGEAGLGKTRLLDAFADSVPRAVRTAGRPGDAGVPFTTLARLLRAVLERSDATASPVLLPSVRQEIARVLPEWGEGRMREGEGQRFVLQRAVQTLLDGATALEGLVIDDLHFADAATLEMLQALIDAGHEAPSDAGYEGQGHGAKPLRWVLAYRPAETGTHLRAFHDALLDIAVPARVTLVPLDEAEIAELVDSLALPGVRGIEVAAYLLKRTGGNPLFVLETLKQAWSDSSLTMLASGKAPNRPQTVQQLIERRLAQLSPMALTLARLAAVAVLDFSIELAERVLGQPALQLASAWSELEAAQVLRDGRFAHDLVYEATLSSVPGEIARHTHSAVARWLAAHSGEPARIASHWIAAGEDELAIAPLREAARRSTERTCVAEARGLLEQAAAICAAAGRRQDEFAVRFALHQNYIADDPGVAHEELVQRLHALAGNEVEQLDAAWAQHNLRRFRQTTSPIADLEADIARAEQLGDDRVLASLAAMLVNGYLALSQPDNAAAVLQRHHDVFERSPQRTDLPDSLGHLSLILGECDRNDESLRHLIRAADLYRAADEPAEVMVMMCNQTLNLRQQGRMVAARDLFERIDRWHGSNAPNPRAWLVSRVGACEVLRELGRYEASLKTLRQPVAETRLQLGPLYAALANAEARLWLALGQLTRAQQAVGEMGDDHSALPEWLQARCRLTAVQVAARIHGTGECDRPSADDWQALDAAARLAPRDRRRATWFECDLQRAAWLEPSTGAALAESIDIVATHHGLMGHAQQARLCVAERRLAAGQTALALQWVRAAQRAQEHRFGAEPGAEPVHPVGSSEAGRDLIVARVLLAADDAGAPGLIAAAGQRLAQLLEQDVPEEFRHSFVHRNPVHRDLLALVRANA